MRWQRHSMAIFVSGLFCGLVLNALLADSLVTAGSPGGNDEPEPPAAECDADIAPPGGDGVVNVGDLLAVINAWGQCEPDPPPPVCDPSGFWFSSAPASYTCATGLFIMNISAWEFSQSGSTLLVTPCCTGGIAMTGPATDCVAGNSFTVTASAQSGCSVTYTLSGTFDSNTQFTGTFTVAFTGSCFNCFTQVFNITATHK